jgi:hypothetical protein
LFSKTSRPALVPAQLYGLFPQRWSARDVKLTSHLFGLRC